MKKPAKISLIIASLFISLGLIICLIAGTRMQWDFTKNYQTNTYQLTEDFTDISIKTDTADIPLSFPKFSKIEVKL